MEEEFPQTRSYKSDRRVMSSGANGIKVTLSGRVGGAEISRTEKFKAGSVPTQTLRESIDYVSRSFKKEDMSESKSGCIRRGKPVISK